MTEPAPADDPRQLTTLARVNRTLSRAEDDASDPSVLEVVEAVNSLVPTWADPAGPDGEWAPHQRLGAAFLAARLYRRKDSPGGMANFGIEGAGYVSGNWQDVALLLGIGSSAVGRFG